MPPYNPVGRALTAVLDAPNGCDWACAAPFRIYSGTCVPCNLTKPVDPALAGAHPWLLINGTGVTGSAQISGVNYTFYTVFASEYIWFTQNATVHVLVTGGGGAAAPRRRDPRAGRQGRGSGQIWIAYGIAATRGKNYTIKIGAGGAGVYGTYGVGGWSSAAFGVTEIAGGNGGPEGGREGGR